MKLVCPTLRTDRVLGASILASEGGELVQILGTLIAFESAVTRF